mmetsp:Transcript_29910/g.76870  ORF Transcript_29910/g.76870 Transcript_29910/m.76870 type:complete len:100 (-) Transcript_29910:112-411(-)
MLRRAQRLLAGARIRKANQPVTQQPPAPHANQQHTGQQQQPHVETGGIGRQIALIAASIVGTYIAFVMVSVVFGRRQIQLVHKDEQGRVVDPRTGKPIG